MASRNFFNRKRHISPPPSLFEGIAINRETSQEIAQELMSKIQEFTKRVKSGM